MHILPLPSDDTGRRVAMMYKYVTSKNSFGLLYYRIIPTTAVVCVERSWSVQLGIGRALIEYGSTVHARTYELLHDPNALRMDED